MLSGQCKSMEDVQNMLKPLFKGTVEKMLEAEMDEHFDYEKHDAIGNNSGNSRNGFGKKTVKTEWGRCFVAQF